MATFTFFNLSPNDLSVNLLGKIFGSMGGVLNPQGSTTVFSSDTLLGAMFSYFNSVVLAIGALIIIYVTIIGVLSTAAEGEVMGKKFNNIWIPIRVVFGVALLIPNAAGYSTIQVLMMWIILQGVAAADSLWTSALTTIQKLGSPYVASSQVTDIGTQQTMKSLFGLLACDATARESRTNPTGLKNSDGGYYCVGNNTGFCKSPIVNITPTTQTYKFGPNGSCGSLTLCDTSPKGKNCKDPTSPACLGCKAQYPAMQSVISVLSNSALLFEQTDYSYRDFYSKSAILNNPAAVTSWGWIGNYCSAQAAPIPPNQCCVPSNASPDVVKTLINPCQASSNSFPGMNDSNNSFQSPSAEAVTGIYGPYGLTALNNLIVTVTQNYTNDILNAVMPVNGPNSSAQQLAKSYQTMASDGWILAGAYYNTLARGTSAQMNATIPGMSVTSPDLASGTMTKFRNNYSGSLALVGGGANTDLSGVSTQTVNDIQAQFGKLGGVSSDPILQMQIAGTMLLITAQIIWVIYLIVVGTGSLLGNISAFVLGTGITNPVGPWIQNVTMFVGPLFYGALALIVSLGGTLAIYIPLIPYIVFTMGAIGWMLGVIEAIVAAPLVALGILSPSGEHELMGKAAPAINMIFNVFLRPSLMLFGLFAGMLLANVVLTLINKSMWGPVILDPVFTAAYTPLGFAMFLAAYVMLVTTAMNKCFTLIHLLPQQVLGWIGGQGQPGGAETGEGAMSAAKGGVAAAGTQAEKGFSAGAQMKSDKKKDESGIGGSS